VTGIQVSCKAHSPILQAVVLFFRKLYQEIGANCDINFYGHLHHRKYFFINTTAKTRPQIEENSQKDTVHFYRPKLKVNSKG
jgi:hypothetical protein